ncbi:NUDIX hydrolase [Lampropedia puyangensis]|uniref:Phosphatase NudJ n=1 Tax=Lampropedia puyangensis TaxID=1330072 RepID=A0A4S8FAY0_9BURK|nr:NUDIX hydrolase [Lampropedia puyangensis]THU03674.1 NUDIX hydrolase [Lampropedia puyangensis]
MQKRWKPNVTVAAVIEREGRFLLVEEDTRDGLRLNTPAGHLDPGEDPVQACRRETLEESAHDFTPTALVGIYLNRFMPSSATQDITYLRFTFCGTLGQHHPDRALDYGIVRAVWMTPEEIRAAQARHRSPIVMQCIDDYLAGKRFPIDILNVDPSVYLQPRSATENVA